MLFVFTGVSCPPDVSLGDGLLIKCGLQLSSTTSFTKDLEPNLSPFRLRKRWKKANSINKRDHGATDGHALVSFQTLSKSAIVGFAGDPLKIVMNEICRVLL
jgi:hypothetical protein